jgi:type III secretory pathway component EscV
MTEQEVPAEHIAPGLRLPEKILVIQSVLMVVLLLVVGFLVLRTNSLSSAVSCNAALAYKNASVSNERTTYGDEGRAAAAALANSVIAAASSPQSVQVPLTATAEKVYSNAMVNVTAGLQTHPAPTTANSCGT